MTLNRPRLNHTLRRRFEASEKFVEKGKTAEASDLNQLTVTEALIEILATLEEISDVLQILAGVNKAEETKPVKLAALKGK